MYYVEPHIYCPFNNFMSPLKIISHHPKSFSDHHITWLLQTPTLLALMVNTFAKTIFITCETFWVYRAADTSSIEDP